DGDDNVWAVDGGGNRVQKFSPSGHYRSQFGSGEGELFLPSYLDVDPEGNLWIANQNQRVQKWER
ncbi:MAG TPA: hypothetical protein VFY04_12235, partial [Solirubrobacterales bacterium]|nr:hypothetical protein [Solirubrobacterales bacterium]